MAANNLRIIYDNQVDYTNSTITASSTATTATTAASLKSDVRSLVWRSATTTGPNPPVIIKSAATASTVGVYSNLTLSTTSTGVPVTALYYTLTPFGGTENSIATTGATTTSIADTAGIHGFVFRTYNSNSILSTKLDQETIPVLYSVAGVITPVLTNDWHRVPSDPSGTTMNYINSGTAIYVYDGSTPLRYNTTVTSAGVFTVAAVGTNITAGTLSSGGSGAFAVCGQHLNMTTGSTPASVLYTVSGRTWANTAFTSTITQSLEKSLVNSADTAYTTLSTSTLARAMVVLSVPLNTNTVEAAVLTYSNLSRGSTIRVLGSGANTVTFTGTVDTPVINTIDTPIINTNHILCCPFTSTSMASWTNLSYGTVTWGLDRQIARVYVPTASQSPCRNVILDIVDPNSVDRYIEASRLICGEYWSPKFNTEYGLSVGLKDDSEVNRSESGGLITTNGVVYKTLNFNLNHLTTSDRNEMVKLLRNAGKRRGIFISLFPENSDDWEQESLYQLYGKLSDGFDLSHPYYQYFSTSIQLEEI